MAQYNGMRRREMLFLMAINRSIHNSIKDKTQYLNTFYTFPDVQILCVFIRLCITYLVWITIRVCSLLFYK